jgi:hypothetical protein
MSGAAAEKASPLESVSLRLKNVDQIDYAPPDDPDVGSSLSLSPLGIVQQQPRGDLPFLLVAPQVPIEILGGDRRQSLCPVREFPGDAEVIKGWKSVPQRNKFRTTTRIARRTRQILAEFAFRSEPEFYASVLCDHAEARPLAVAAQRFRRASEADQLLQAAGLR